MELMYSQDKRHDLYLKQWFKNNTDISYLSLGNWRSHHNILQVTYTNKTESYLRSGNDFYMVVFYDDSRVEVFKIPIEGVQVKIGIAACEFWS